ncbi:hypothetical protein V3C99_011791 [Haemonchus contortus]
MVGRSMRSGTSNVRSFWQASVADEERAKRETIRSASSKPYSFPRWRSTDALSASLVASNNVDVPKDSRIPEQRLQKMKETERMAEIHKAQIHEQVMPPQSLRKGKSLDSLVLQVDHQPWYDKSKIRDAVCRESIGNIAEARERFESQDFSRLNRGPGHQRVMHRQVLSSESESIGRQTPSQHSIRSEGSQVQSSTYYSTEDTTTECRTPSYSNGYEHVGKSTVQSLDQIYTNEEQLFMLYMKQNPEIMSSLGIACSSATRQVVENLPRIPVELRLVDDNNSVFSTSPRQGRYLKKGSTAPSNHIYSKIRKHEPREVYDQAHAEAIPEKRIGSLIKSEIKQLRRREDELHESRKELGLPTLEEMMELWKRGPQTITLRSAARFDHPRTPILRSSQLNSSNGSVDC